VKQKNLDEKLTSLKLQEALVKKHKAEVRKAEASLKRLQDELAGQTSRVLGDKFRSCLRKKLSLEITDDYVPPLVNGLEQFINTLTQQQVTLLKELLAAKDKQSEASSTDGKTQTESPKQNKTSSAKSILTSDDDDYEAGKE
jgi:hypothetical protein